MSDRDAEDEKKKPQHFSGIVIDRLRSWFKMVLGTRCLNGQGDISIDKTLRCLGIRHRFAGMCGSA